MVELETSKNLVHLPICHHLQDLIQVFNIHRILYQLGHQFQLSVSDVLKEFLARLSLIKVRNFLHELHVGRVQ